MAPSSSASPTLATLRGATVDVDARRVQSLVVILLMAGLAIAAALLFVAGVHKNTGINLLRHHGVPVEVTVAGCRGLLGGSGSNPVGYTCSGTFDLGSRSYSEGIPGNTLLAPGAKLRMLSVPSDPSLLAAPGVVAGEYSSGRVFVAPVVLLALLVGLASAALIRRRRRQPVRRAPFGLGGARRLGEVVGGV